MKRFKKYCLTGRFFSNKAVKKVNIKSNLSYLFDSDKCRFCKGAGKIPCFKCDIYYVKENWCEKKCTNCVDGMLHCCFCGGNGKSHQIF